MENKILVTRSSMPEIDEYMNEILQHEKASHIRINMIPDGGISRVRLWGKIAK